MTNPVRNELTAARLKELTGTENPGPLLRAIVTAMITWECEFSEKGYEKDEIIGEDVFSQRERIDLAMKVFHGGFIYKVDRGKT